MKTKLCPHCTKILPVDCFYKRKNGSPRSWCKECNKECARNFYKKNPDYNKEKSSEWQKANKKYASEYKKTHRRKIYITESCRKYGIEKDFAESLVSKEHCEICGKKISFNNSNIHLRPNIDHCHTTNNVRGVLCGYCNNLLGRCFDDASILQKAIRYLNERG